MKPIDLMELLDELPEEDIAEELDYQPIPKHRTFLVSKPFLAGASTAACLLAVVGLSISVWSKQQKIETKPPQETQTTTVSEIETTEQVTTESQTTESTKKSETTTIPALNSDQLQQPTSAAALLTTVAPTETMTATVITRQTNAATISTQQNTPPAVNTRTAPPQTSVTAKISGQIAPVTEQSTTNMPTNPATTTVIITTTQPQTDPPETSYPTYTTELSKTETETQRQTQPTDILNPTGTTYPLNPTETTVPTDPTYTLNGFDIEKVSYDPVTKMRVWHIAAQPGMNEPDDFSITYQMKSDRFQIDSEFISDNTRYFQIYDNELERTFTLLQQKRSDFHYYWQEDGTKYIDAFPKKQKGFFTGDYKERVFFICWYDGYYVMSIETDTPNLIGAKLPEQFRANTY